MSPQCFKIIQKVLSYNIASEASYVYVLSGIESKVSPDDDFWHENSKMKRNEMHTWKAMLESKVSADCEFWRENSGNQNEMKCAVGKQSKFRTADANYNRILMPPMPPTSILNFSIIFDNYNRMIFGTKIQMDRMKTYLHLKL